MIPLSVLILLGFLLRLFPLLRDPLHQDEALYGYWGRLIASGRDVWLASVPVDKPPIVPYLIAGSQTLFGVSEFAIRLPGLASSLLSIPLTFALAVRLYADRLAALIAAGVVAVTPYPVLFGGTAFTDPILVALWLAACYGIARGRWALAGWTLGLAWATKQQAVVLTPLVVGLGLLRLQCRSEQKKPLSASLRFLSGSVVPVFGMVVWDALRRGHGAATGFWGQGFESYGGLRPIWSPELGPRLLEWARLGGYLLVWPLLGALFVVGLGWLLGRALTSQRRTNPALVDLALAAFFVAYLLLHWLVAFPVWDRYLLPLAPVIGLLLGRMTSQALGLARGTRALTVAGARFTGSIIDALLIVMLVGLFAGSAINVVREQVPVGGDHGTYAGLHDVIHFLQVLPVGTVLYDRWLTWHYDFYLFDAYLYRAGFPSPSWLAADAAAFFDGRPRYLVLPGWESAGRLKRALADVHLEIFPALTTYRRDGTASFVVYEIGARY